MKWEDKCIRKFLLSTAPFRYIQSHRIVHVMFPLRRWQLRCDVAIDGETPTAPLSIPFPTWTPFQSSSNGAVECKRDSQRAKLATWASSIAKKGRISHQRPASKATSHLHRYIVWNFGRPWIGVLFWLYLKFFEKTRATHSIWIFLETNDGCRTCKCFISSSHHLFYWFSQFERIKSSIWTEDIRTKSVTNNI